jgi:23S rRNA-/tRNA-specific pseudouridylate synthase
MSSLPEVALVWERAVTSRSSNSVSCIKVSLQPIKREEIGAVTDVEWSESHPPSNAESETGDNCSIPDPVLLYERQMRKAQHAKKTGQALPEELQVIYVDEWIVVINKPAGVLTVPGLNNHLSLLDRVHALYGEQVSDPANMIVHRLDMDTSGLVIFARSLEVSKQLHAIFRDRKVVKEYECLVVGHLCLPTWPKDDDIVVDASTSTFNTILIDLPLQRDHEHPPFMRVSTPQSETAAMACVDQLQKHGWKKILRKPAKPSQSLVTIVEVATRESVTVKEKLPYTRLRLEPITGRTHQLRVHWYVPIVLLQTLFQFPCVHEFLSFCFGSQNLPHIVLQLGFLLSEILPTVYMVKQRCLVDWRI